MRMRKQLADVDAVIEKVLHHIRAPVLARPSEAVLHLRRRCDVLQPAVGIEKGLHEFEPPHARRPFQIERRAPTSEILCGIAASIGEATVYKSRRATAAVRVKAGTMFEQYVDQFVQYPRHFGVDARRDKAERRASAAIHVGPGVDFCAGVEQHAGNLYRRLGSPLAESFNAVGAKVVKKRRMMAAGGPRSNESRFVSKQ